MSSDQGPQQDLPRAETEGAGRHDVSPPHGSDSIPGTGSRRRHPWPLLLLGLIAVGLFADALLPSRTLIPTGFLYQRQPWTDQAPALAGDPVQQYDLLYQFYPWARFYRESLLKGEIPLWDPHSYLGTPFWANPQTAVLFPGSWLHLLMPLQTSFTLLFMLKAALGLTGMFLWLRRGGLQAPAAFLGSVVFALSTHTLVSLAFPYSSVTVLFPWALLALDRLLRIGAATSLGIGPQASRGKRTASWTALVLSVGLLVSAGQPQSALAALAALGLYGLLQLAGPIRSRHSKDAEAPPGPPVPRLRTALLAASAVVAGGLLCAIQWLPSLDYVSESMVGAGPRILSSGLPYLPGNLLNFLVPDLFGSPLKGDFWGFPGYHDAAFYSSLTALLLAPFALLRPGSGTLNGSAAVSRQAHGEGARAAVLNTESGNAGPPARPRHGGPVDGPLFPALLGLLSLVLLLGIPPLESLLDLPGFDLVRRNKVAFLLVFALASLAAQGCGRLLNRLSASRSGDGSTTHAGRASRPGLRAMPGAALSLWAALLAVLVLGVLLWFSGQRAHFSGGSFNQPEPWIGLAVLAAAAAALLWSPRAWRGRLVAALVSAELLLAGYGLNPRGGSQALFPPLPVLQEHLEGPLPRLYSTRHTLLAPNSGIIYGFQDVRGYDVMTPRRLFRYMQAVDPGLGDEWTAMQALPRERLHPQSRMLAAFDRALASRWGPQLKEYLKSESYWSVTASRITRTDLFQRLNIEWLWTSRQEAPAAYEPVAEGSYATLHRNSKAAEAAVFFDWVEAKSPAQALQRLLRGGQSASPGTQRSENASARPQRMSARTAVVEAQLPDFGPGQSGNGGPAAGRAAGDGALQGEWQLLEASPKRRSYRVALPAPALFVDLGRYSHGWTVKVGDTETTAIAVDSLFRGVFLLPGEHQVEFRYQPASFQLGMLLSGLALFLSLGVWSWGKLAVS